jgi:RimJ/RimL family protein N-acetyltransferase
MIKGNNIFLRPLELTDSSFMLKLLNDLDISALEGKNEFLKNEFQQKTWFENNIVNENRLSFIIVDQASIEKVGYLSFKYLNHVRTNGHIGIKIDPIFQKKGYGTDSLNTIMSYLFLKMNLNRLQSTIAEYNKGSLKLFVDKCGWKKEGILRKSIYSNGEFFDNVMVGILKDDYMNSDENK